MLNKKEIPKRLKSAREALRPETNPRQFALGAKGVDPSQYTKYESGKGTLGNDKIKELCSTWNISEDWLFMGRGDMFTGDKNRKDEEVVIKFGPDDIKKMLADIKASSTDLKDSLKDNQRILEKYNDSLLRIIEVNLTAILSNQNGGIGIVGEILRRNVFAEAKGNPDEVKKILDDIVHRIGPDSGKILSTGMIDGTGS